MGRYDLYAKNTHHFDFQSPNYDNDRLLYKKVLAEAYNHYGVPMDFYVTTYDTSYDKIFGEDNNRRFIRKFRIRTYYTLPKEENLWTKFGIEGIDNFHMWCSKESFAAESTTKSKTGGSFSPAFSTAYDIYSETGLIYEYYPEYTPKIGDILKAVYNNYIYEVVIVKEEEEMFLQGKHSWDFIVKPFIDEHMTVSAGPLSGDDIENYVDTQDIFNVSGAVAAEKKDILYQPPVGSVFNGW